MRLAVHEDFVGLQDLYFESTKHANQVGYIDRPELFDEEYFLPYIDAEEFYCFDIKGRIVGGARLTEVDPPPTIWADEESQFLYVGRLATSDSVRNTQFFPRVMLPEIVEVAKQRDKVGLRLSCLGNNQRLVDFYSRLGFNNLGMAQIFSSFYQKHVHVARFERSV